MLAFAERGRIPNHAHVSTRHRHSVAPENECPYSEDLIDGILFFTIFIQKMISYTLLAPGRFSRFLNAESRIGRPVFAGLASIFLSRGGRLPRLASSYGTA